MNCCSSAATASVCPPCTVSNTQLHHYHHLLEMALVAPLSRSDTLLTLNFYERFNEQHWQKLPVGQTNLCHFNYALHASYVLCAVVSNSLAHILLDKLYYLYFDLAQIKLKNLSSRFFTTCFRFFSFFSKPLANFLGLLRWQSFQHTK